MIYSLGEKSPKLGQGAYVAPSADVIGDVSLGDQASVWFGAILRGDNEPISIGARSNIQDGTVIHVDAGYPVLVEEDVTVGHKVMLHGCTIKRGALIGINAVVLNGAVIGENTLVGANALVTENTVVPDNSLFLGSPGKVIKSLSPEAIEMIRQGAQHYVDKAAQYAETLVSEG